MSDAQIIHKRKTGYSPLQIYQYHQNNNPNLDELICLTHVSRVCSEAGLPFSKQQVKRVFNKHYSKEFHGSKSDYWNFIAKHCSDKILLFKTEKKKHTPVEKCAVDPCFSTKEARRCTKLKLMSESKGNTQEGLK